MHMLYAPNQIFPAVLNSLNAIEIGVYSKLCIQKEISVLMGSDDKSKSNHVPVSAFPDNYDSFQSLLYFFT